MQKYNRIGTIGLIALVALRLGVGWHFFKEGSDKIKSGNFSSEGFLKGANGRFAGFYQGMIWDYDGKIRLDENLMTSKIQSSLELENRPEPEPNKEPVIFPGGKSAEKHFNLTQEQTGELKKLVERTTQKLKSVYSEYNDSILKLEKGEDRVAKMDRSPTWNEVASLRGQKEWIEKERRSAVVPALKDIDDIWNEFQVEVNQLATPQQLKSSGLYQLKRPQEGLLTSATVDRIIPIFDITVGILLILGLFVPLAGWAGAAFLISVILSQFPGDPGTQPTYLYAVEALAMITLASTGAGRFGGLDFLIWARRQRKSAEAAA